MRDWLPDLRRIVAVLALGVAATFTATPCMAAAEDSSAARALLEKAAELWDRQDFQGAQEASEQALSAYRALGMEEEAAATLGIMGMAATELGNSDRALGYYQQALTIYRKIGLEEPAALILNALGLSAANLGGYEQAVGYYEQALAIFRRLGLQEEAASALGGLGDAATGSERYEQALAYYQEGLTAYRELGLERQAADTLRNMGGVAFHLSQSDQAQGYYEEALAIYRRLGLEKDEMVALQFMGLVAMSSSGYDKGMGYYEQALAISRKLGLGEPTAVALTVMGQAAADLTQYDKALGYYDEAAAIYRKLGLEQKAADTLVDLGDVAESAGKRDRAASYYEQALATYRKLGMEKETALTLRAMGRVVGDSTQWDRALGYYQEALTTYRQAGMEKDAADTLADMGLAAARHVQHWKAAGYWEEALATYRRLGLEEDAASILNNIGVSAVDAAQYDKAWSCCRDALSVFRKLGLEDKTANALLNLGSIAWALDRYDTALDCYQQALAITRRPQQEETAAKIVSNMGLVAEGLGQYEKAFVCYQEALASFRKAGREGETAGVLINLGNLAVRLGQYDQAAKQYEQALATARKLGLEMEAGRVLADLGLLSARLGESDAALSYYQQALTLFRSLQLPLEAWMCELNIADVYMAQGRLAEARVLLGQVDRDPMRQGRYELLAGEPDRAAQEFRQAGEEAAGRFDKRVASQIGLGLALEAQGDWEEAAGAYSKAVELIEGARSRTPMVERGHFLEAKDYGFRRLEAYEGLARVLHGLGRDDEAFLWSEHTKARVLVEALARVPYGTPVGLPAELRKQEDDLTNQVAALSKQLEEKPELRETIAPQLKPLQEALDALVSRLRREYPEYASLKYPQPLPASELALAPGEVLLAYEVTEPETLAFLVRGGKVEGTFEIKITRAELAKLVREYQQGYEEVSGPADLKRVDLNPSHRLYGLLLQEPLSQVKPGEQVVIVPDEAIGLVPMEGLAVSLPAEVTWKEGPHGASPEGVHYVGDDYTFSYWQSGTSLTMVRRLHKGGGGDRVLVVADPVFDVADARVAGTTMAQAPKTAEGEFNLMREVRDDLTASYGQLVFRRLAITGSLPERLRSTYGDKLTAWVGLEAKESKLKREPLEGYGEVLFSTHGVLDENVSWLQQPALVLSLVGNEEGEDGYLTMAEVMDLKLGAEVVGLMACESGAGRVVSGEGVMGMGRAFQYAGARTVLASLWSVEDESTNLLAESFLQAVKAGQDKAAALASARQALRQAGYDHPFYWAPFVVVGER